MSEFAVGWFGSPDPLLFFHKLSFFIWGAVFVIHFLWYVPRMARSGAAWRWR